MHYVTQRSHYMQKHKFSIMSNLALLMETALGPPKQGMQSVDVLLAKRTGMLYVPRISHRPSYPVPR
jgi:hypothetical protein